jgi:4-hydroxy-2-oxoheptanedioate aldolase
MAAGSRAAEFGKIPLIEHMAQSNREVVLACMIEDMAAVDRIDEIAAVEGVDLLAVGPSDLSRSLGVSGSPTTPDSSRRSTGSERPSREVPRARGWPYH